ncbi:tRNA dihydrouridine synthase DusB [Psittacicella hinzii]|uniref:tRNA-dihydrouridine synthase n=1 Tax=Psittacicella hinzii TaxID=2028575 RepID=A0A3A1YBK2_9GAMM|nr:tRNA dihydrouridine synthase DusB [Psittacicella hinzii]RIY34746.1 tRNA dihydrouridine synthase DusB [Psittacicella hinzii]
MSVAFKIGQYNIKNSVILAPMAGITDSPYRQIHLAHGVGLAVSEMVLANTQMLHQGESLKHLEIQDLAPEIYQQYQVPRVMQLLGYDPQAMGNLAKLIVEHNLADIIDINMGCPAKKVVKKAAGSALMAEPETVKAILEQVVAHAHNKPVSLKMRTGVDLEHKNALQLALLAQDIGVKSIVIHGRTRADLFNGQAEYDTIAQVKQELEIPVIANGDVDSLEKYLYVKDYTNADGIMLGRASQGNPWLMQKLVAFATKTKYIEPNLLDKFVVVMKHIELIYQTYEPFLSYKIARKHFIWYLEQLFPQVFTTKTKNNLESEQYIQKHIVLNSEQHKQIDYFYTNLYTSAESRTLDSTKYEEVYSWKKGFTTLNSALEQTLFIQSCYAKLKNWL